MSDDLVKGTSVKKQKSKVRNYSFQNSKRLPESRMTEINGVRIPSMPGSCYHAIICALAHHKNQLCSWQKVYEDTEKYMCQYGGVSAWNKFKEKGNVKSWQQRIKDNCHTLTRSGKDCYGYRLHERGMVIYFFRDGAILYTGGEFQDGDNYDVLFPDGFGLQVRYRGTTMTYREYQRFIDLGYINKSGKILDAEGIHKFRERKRASEGNETLEPASAMVQVCVSLGENVDQDTALRLESLGLVVEEALDNEIIGHIPANNLDTLQSDKDVDHVEVSG